MTGVGGTHRAFFGVRFYVGTRARRIARAICLLQRRVLRRRFLRPMKHRPFGLIRRCKHARGRSGMRRADHGHRRSRRAFRIVMRAGMSAAVSASLSAA